MEKVITVETMRKSDAYTIANYIDSKKLMYKAGVGVFNSYDYKGNIAIVCGSGNNAGDGYVLSLLLKEKNISSTLFLIKEKFLWTVSIILTNVWNRIFLIRCVMKVLTFLIMTL